MTTFPVSSSSPSSSPRRPVAMINGRPFDDWDGAAESALLGWQIERWEAQRASEGAPASQWGWRRIAPGLLGGGGWILAGSSGLLAGAALAMAAGALARGLGDSKLAYHRARSQGVGALSAFSCACRFHAQAMVARHLPNPLRAAAAASALAEMGVGYLADKSWAPQAAREAATAIDQRVGAAFERSLQWRAGRALKMAKAMGVDAGAEGYELLATVRFLARWDLIRMAEQNSPGVARKVFGPEELAAQKKFLKQAEDKHHATLVFNADAVAPTLEHALNTLRSAGVGGSFKPRPDLPSAAQIAAATLDRLMAVSNFKDPALEARIKGLAAEEEAWAISSALGEPAGQGAIKTTRPRL